MLQTQPGNVMVSTPQVGRGLIGHWAAILSIRDLVPYRRLFGNPSRPTCWAETDNP
jgi:hypothetical protein